MWRLIIALIVVANVQSRVFGAAIEEDNTLEENWNFNETELENIIQVASYPPNGLLWGSKEFTIVALLPVNWFTAQQLCSLYGLTLASINSPDEGIQLQQYLVANGLSHEIFWTSGTNLSGYNRYFWMSNGVALSYTRWNPGEPNNSKGVENCLEILPNGYWNDQNCKTPRYFVCENRCPLTSYDVPIYPLKTSS